MTNLRDFDSLYNRLAENAEASHVASNVEIHDLTLEADGEEMAGLRFTHKDRIEIAKGLDAAGVHRMSVLGNSPSPTRNEIRSAQAIVDLGLKSKTGAFVKTIAEIETSAQIGLWGVTILVGVNDTVLTGARTGQDIIDQCKTLTAYAKERGLHVCLMGMDSTRTRPEFLKRIITELDPFFDEYTIADSLGRITPFGIRYLATLIGQWTAKPLQLHPHNTTSMAVANCLGAVMGGVSILQTSMNGLGEFTGIAATEECAVALEMHAGISLGIELPKLQELATLVASATGLPIPPGKPVTGSGAFAIPETEEIQQALYELYCEDRFEDGLPFPSELVGAESHMSIGRKCNAYTVLYNLAVNGIKVDLSTAEDIAKKVRAQLGNRKGYVLMSQNKFLDLVRATI
ncbi:MAG: isopropylmalate/homocitrate/citramalate synthase [Oleiphilaceae bacterium]|jgi:isopropylmalate/homocitrate/citramalate synthase